jgi:2-dehydro-3-deoxygluconokinase
MSPQVVTLGEAMLRLSAPAGERLEAVESLDVHVAGAEANVAAALASLGVPVAWVSALPDLPLGRRVARALRGAGVDVGFVEWVDQGRIGLFFIEFGATPRPTAVWYDRQTSAFSQMSEFDPTVLDEARFAVSSGVTMALGDGPRRLAESFIGAARERGVSVCLDVNYRERLWAPSAARRVLEPMLGQAKIIVCSRRDAERVFGVDDAEGAEAAALELRERFAPEAAALVLTDGASGCVGISGSSVFVQAAPTARVVDRIGAGDAFVAGLLWGMLSDVGLGESLRYATALGALACTVRGDQALFTPAEIRAAATETVAMIR